MPLAGPTAVLPCASDECRTTWRGPCTARPLADVSVGCDDPATHCLALVCGGGVDSSGPPRGREEKNLETKVAGPVRRRTRSMRRCPAPTCTLPQNQAITRVAKIWQDFPSARHGMMPSPIRYGREESKTVKFPRGETEPEPRGGRRVVEMLNARAICATEPADTWDHPSP